MARIRWETFMKKYKPIKNNVVKTSCFDGYMFETYGKEIKTLLKMAKKFGKSEGGLNGYHVWTVIDGERNKIIITNGWHVCNRLGYLITKNRWLEGEDIEVI